MLPSPVERDVKIDRQRLGQRDALDLFRRSLAVDGEVRGADPPHHHGHALPLGRELELPDNADFFLERQLQIFNQIRLVFKNIYYMDFCIT